MKNTFFKIFPSSFNQLNRKVEIRSDQKPNKMLINCWAKKRKGKTVSLLWRAFLRSQQVEVLGYWSGSHFLGSSCNRDQFQCQLLKSLVLRVVYWWEGVIHCSLQNPRHPASCWRRWQEKRRMRSRPTD
jgi:hypothetical protein